MARTAPATYDVIVIGGGASGLAAALTSARAGARTAIVECDVDCGLPILATGNGRCNLSNERLRPARYRHPVIARAVLGEHPEETLAAWFDSVGIWTTSDEGRLYPMSKRAESVRDALLAACERADVAKLCAHRLIHAAWNAEDGLWKLETLAPAAALHAPRARDEHARLRALRRALAQAPMHATLLQARAIVLAPGGASEALCQVLDIPHLEERPVLCPIACQPASGEAGLEPDALVRLDGVRADARLTLVRGGTPLWSEDGEVLFRAYGLSGIAAFNLSRRIERDDIIEVDLFPTLSEDELRERLRARIQVVGRLERKSVHWFDGVLAPALGRIVTLAGEGSTGKAARAAKRLAFRARGVTETKSAQVRCGGIPFSAVDAETLRLKCASGGVLFACGEALDMDADCGGFNLAWAWLSGLRAGAAAAREVTS